jgi:phosphoesterase RecJ-like protein
MELSLKYRQAYEMIRKAEKILLVTHGKPDGDAVSSICAMMLVCEDLDKEYEAFCLDRPPASLAFLPLSEKINSNKTDLDFASFDLIVALDCGSLSRTNLAPEIRARKKEQLTIEFDHHPKIDNYSDLEIRIPEAASTSEIIYFFLKANYLKITKKLANCVLTGILTDTGNFLYPSTTEKTVSIASEMLLYGAKYPLITEETWRNKSLGAMKLWGRAIGSLEINPRYNLAFAVLTKKDIDECQCSDEEMEGIAGFLSNLYGVNGLVLIREADKGLIKGNLRTSMPGVDVSKLAHRLGGGGHRNASGFTFPGRLSRQGDEWRID